MRQADIKPHELVLDIGAGEGAVTRPLVNASALVVAVELNRERAQRLRDRFADDPVTVVEADASDLRLPRRPFRVVANPPFSVSQRLVRRLLWRGSRMTGAHLIVPRHVARTWTGRNAPGAARWSSEFSLSAGPSIPRHAFVPAPPREAVMLVITRHIDLP